MPTEASEKSVKVDRDEVFLELTKSICPLCKRVIDAEVNAREGRVIMRKRCPDHGVFEALVYSDAELYMAQLRFNKPGTLPLGSRPRCARVALSTAAFARTTSSTRVSGSSR